MYELEFDISEIRQFVNLIVGRMIVT